MNMVSFFSERRDKNKYCHPEMLPETYLRYLTGSRPIEYWIFCDTCLNDGMHETKTFTIPVRVLIFYMRLRQRKTIQEIAVLYDYNNLTEIESQFMETLVIYFAHSNELPRLLASPTLSDDDKDDLFEEIMEDVSPMHRQIAENIADPLDMDRFDDDDN